MPSRREAHWKALPPVWRHGGAWIPRNSNGRGASMPRWWKRRPRSARTESPKADQMARFGELNLAFHNALIALAKSPMLQLSLDRVQSIAFASPAAVVTPAEPGGFVQAIREHEAILDAVQMGDAARAEALVREHARFALKGVKNALDRPGRAKNNSGHHGAQRPRGRIHAAPDPQRRNGRAHIPAGARCSRGLVLRKRIRRNHDARDRSPPRYPSGVALLPHVR